MKSPYEIDIEAYRTALEMAIRERNLQREKVIFWRILAIGFAIFGTICFAILK